MCFNVTKKTFPSTGVDNKHYNSLTFRHYYNAHIALASSEVFFRHICHVSVEIYHLVLFLTFFWICVKKV